LQTVFSHPRQLPPSPLGLGKKKIIKAIIMTMRIIFFIIF